MQHMDILNIAIGISNTPYNAFILGYINVSLYILVLSASYMVKK